MGAERSGHRVLPRVRRRLLSLAAKVTGVAFGPVVGSVTSVITRVPAVALTFDGGPDPHWTPRLLAALQRHQAHATFFMIGKYAARHPEIVREAAGRGHAIANHSWDHPSFPLISHSERRRQIRACAEALAPYEQRLFRPPYGHQDLSSRLDAMLLGYTVVTWSLHAFDWEPQSAQSMLASLEDGIAPGSVVLLHDAVCDRRNLSRANTLAVVEALLTRYADRYRFVTMPELMRLGRARKRNWFKKADIAYLNSYERVT